MAGKLLSVLDCSEILFNDTTQPAYKRTMRLIREAKLDTVKLGRVTYVSRALLYKHFKLEDEEKGSDAPPSYYRSRINCYSLTQALTNHLLPRQLRPG